MSRYGKASGAVVLAALIISVSTTTATAGGQAPRCLGAEATIVVTGGNDVLKGTSGPDVILGLAGKDRISGAAGNDRICQPEDHIGSGR